MVGGFFPQAFYIIISNNSHSGNHLLKVSLLPEPQMSRNGNNCDFISSLISGLFWFLEDCPSSSIRGEDRIGSRRETGAGKRPFVLLKCKVFSNQRNKFFCCYTSEKVDRVQRQYGKIWFSLSFFTSRSLPHPPVHNELQERHMVLLISSSEKEYMS